METKDEVILQNTSILSGGYGLIPKKITRDKDLTMEAKAIYGYLASFAGSGGYCYPSKELMISELGTTEKRFNKNIKLLKEHGYIKIHKRRKGNRNDSNLYELLMDIRDIEITKKEFDTSRFDSGQFDRVQNDSGQIDSVQIDPPNNNSVNSNSINNNSLNKFSSSRVQIEDVIAYYKREIVHTHILSAIEQDFFLKIGDKVQYDLVIRAMEISIEANVKELRYIKGIIKKWLDANITTLEELEAYKLQNKFKSSKSITKNSKNMQSKNVFTQETLDALREKRDENGRIEGDTSKKTDEFEHTDPEILELMREIGVLPKM